MTKKSAVSIAQQIVEAIDTGGFSVIKNRNGGQHIERKQVCTGEEIHQAGEVRIQQQGAIVNEKHKGDKK